MINGGQYSEQDEASFSGPRGFKEKGEPDWCWQTISALQTMWLSLETSYETYVRTWADAEEYRVWEKVPYDNPYGTKEAMLEALGGRGRKDGAKAYAGPAGGGYGQEDSESWGGEEST